MINFFMDKLLVQYQKDSNIYLLVGDIGYSFFSKFKNIDSRRCINVGICQQSMILMAAGLSLMGKKVFVYSIATFPILRCYQQIRNCVSYQNLNVTIIAGGTGFAYDKSGVTHYSLQDIGLMRILPNFQIFSPYYKDQIQWVVSRIINSKNPNYVRLGKNGNIGQDNVSSVVSGVKCLNRKGSVALLAVGQSNIQCKDAVEFLKTKNIDVALYSINQIKPINYEFLKMIGELYKKVYIVQQHLVGGVGSIFKQIINNVNSICVIDYPKYIGSRQYIQKETQIGIQHIVETILKQGIR